MNMLEDIYKYFTRQIKNVISNIAWVQTFVLKIQDGAFCIPEVYCLSSLNWDGSQKLQATTLCSNFAKSISLFLYQKSEKSAKKIDIE